MGGRENKVARRYRVQVEVSPLPKSSPTNSSQLWGSGHAYIFYTGAA